MAEIVVDAQRRPATPSAGKVVIYPELPQTFLTTRDEAGFAHSISRRYNFSTTSQSPAASTAVYITGAQIDLTDTPPIKLGALFKWRLSMTKTAAGTATSTFAVVVGESGNSTDPAMLSFTKPAGTAAVDEAWVDIFVTLFNNNQTTNFSRGVFRMSHNLNSTGHATIPFVSVGQFNGNFNWRSLSPLFFGLTINSGVGDVLTFQMVQAEAILI